MRVMIATTANDGHAGPLLPFAHALAAAGHEVAVTAPASYAEAVGRAGLAHLPFADAPPALVGPVMARLPELGFDEADETVVREIFGRIDARAALPGVTEAVRDWRPDLVLREPAELGSLAAAVHAGVPHAHVAIGVQELTRTLLALLDEPLAELGQLAGVGRSRLGAAALGEPVLTLLPEAFDRAGDAGWVPGREAGRFALRGPDVTEVDLPGWGDPEAPLVYVTFGTVAGSLPPFAGVFREALEALAEQPVRVLMTLGRGVDPGSLGRVPDNVHVVSWWPQDQVLAVAAAVLTHGGFGTTYGALAAGVPQVVAPLFTSDQVANGRHVAASGVGRTVPPGPDVVARAVVELTAVLADPSYAGRARELAGEVAALPSPSEAVPMLEELARG